MPDLAELTQAIGELRSNVERIIVGKSETIRLAITALLARGHVLVEDIPGIGKTALARALARSLDCSFKRIQFTPDLLPADVTGISILDPQRRDFVFKPGPIFANIVLADEINRATPRTQSALLEAMNEAHVSVDGTTHPLPDPFLVFATQNPMEFTGTYPLPESQLDRFLMVLHLGYPRPAEEKQILSARRNGDPLLALRPVMGVERLRELMSLVPRVRADETILDYVIAIAENTRRDRSLIAGVSPRGSLHLARAAQSYALVEGRDFVTPDDVKAVAPSVLAHRIIEKRSAPAQEGRLASRGKIHKVLQEVPVPP